jgi:hypothetical protein
MLTFIIVCCVIFGLIALFGLGALIALPFKILGGLFELVFGLFGAVLGLLGTVLGLVIGGLAVLFAGGIVMLVAGALLLPVLLPVLLLVGLVWLIVRAASPRPAPLALPPAPPLANSASV